MNVNVSLPNTIPLTVQPPTDTMRRDNVQREVIVKTPEMVPYPKESEVGSEKDRNKSRVTAQQYQGQSQGTSNQAEHNRVTERDTQQQNANSQEQSQQEHSKQHESSHPNADSGLTDSEQRELDERLNIADTQDAVSGEVIIEKLEQEQQAALAPSEPYPTDQTTTAQTELSRSENREISNSPLSPLMEARSQAIHQRYINAYQQRSPSSFSVTV